jgi:hypothetical protein
MTSARKACLLRFFFWILFAVGLFIAQNPISQCEFVSILALIEFLIATAPFLEKPAQKEKLKK